MANLIYDDYTRSLIMLLANRSKLKPKDSEFEDKWYNYMSYECFICGQIIREYNHAYAVSHGLEHLKQSKLLAFI